MEHEWSSDSEYWSDPDEAAPAVELREGAVFRSGSSVVHAVPDYALKQGKRVRVMSHGGTDRRVMCTSSDCQFLVRASRRSKMVEGKRLWLDIWQVTTARLEHTNCFSVAKPTARQIAAMTSFAGALKAGYNVNANALIAQVREVEGVSVSRQRRTVYRAIDLVKQSRLEEVKDSFGFIGPYLTAFAVKNPGTVAVAEKDASSRFKRAVIVSGPSVPGVIGCQKILGLDRSHSKNRFFSGVQVHLVGRDGNLENITVAFGLVRAEDSDSYLWFLDKVAEAGIRSQ